MECPNCNFWLEEHEEGSYYEDNSLIEKYIGHCRKCGAWYEIEYERPIVKSTLRKFEKMS